MVILLQSAPLLLLLALLLSGRASPPVACLVALAAAVPAVVVSLPAGVAVPGFLAAEALRALFLAVQPIGVVTGGLLFHAAAGANPQPAAAPPDARRVFVACFLAGAFVESVTGFAVGAVFALASLRGMGLRGPQAGALALLALCLVPWGGLGPGTALGAALAGQPAQDFAAMTAWFQLPWLLCLVPLFWALSRRAGIPVPGREKLAQLGFMVVVCLLLLAANRFGPFEAAGIVASGLPLLWALWRLALPRDAEAWSRAARLLGPWAGLVAALLLARSWHGAPAWQPYAGLPAVPITHVAVVLWLAAAVLLAPLPDGLLRARAALARARRPATAMLLYVLLAGWLARSGAAQGLALVLADTLGSAAGYALPPLGVLAGVVTGSNVGSNSALLPVQMGLAHAVGLPALPAAALHNFMGCASAGMGFTVMALICGLLADGTRPVQLWRLLWPSFAAMLAVGWAGVAIMGAGLG
ncbi:lactate permease [Humitalea rosea]|uniref:Lactate permease n=1 Tax=Humitalea rosea TaxID=990373 RepID=A0A2W7J2T1_9PROT|nr:hypothetical protein [Humitalea rosea]PZW45937.1 lactate permease [Humitalea rosea]